MNCQVQQEILGQEAKCSVINSFVCDKILPAYILEYAQHPIFPA